MKNDVLGICLATMLALLVSCQSSSPIAIESSEANIAFVSLRYVEHPWATWFVSIDSKQQRPILGTNTGIPSSPLAWSPDGQTLALEGVLGQGLSKFDPRYGSHGIMFVDSDGNTSAFKSCSYSPAWSPDGEYLAYHKDCTSHTDEGEAASLSVARLDGTDEREIATGISGTTEDGRRYPIRISWSPDGQHLAFDTWDDSGWSIWIVANNGDELRKLTHGRHPAWSPFGSEIAFDRDGKLWTIVITDETEEEWNIAGIYAEWPEWSPDGSRLAFEGKQNDNVDIYVMDRDGSNLTRLTTDPAWDAHPAWRPTSQ